jgi:hypothetical protein
LLRTACTGWEGAALEKRNSSRPGDFNATPIGIANDRDVTESGSFRLLNDGSAQAFEQLHDLLDISDVKTQSSRRVGRSVGGIEVENAIAQPQVRDEASGKLTPTAGT